MIGCEIVLNFKLFIIKVSLKGLRSSIFFVVTQRGWFTRMKHGINNYFRKKMTVTDNTWLEYKMNSAHKYEALYSHVLRYKIASYRKMKFCIPMRLFKQIETLSTI